MKFQNLRRIEGTGLGTTLATSCGPLPSSARIAAGVTPAISAIALSE